MKLSKDRLVLAGGCIVLMCLIVLTIGVAVAASPANHSVCRVKIVNQHSVHGNTKVVVTDGVNSYEFLDVERAPGLITSADVSLNPAGLTVHVSPGPSGVTSLLSEDVSCEPVKPEPVQVPIPGPSGPEKLEPTPEATPAIPVVAEPTFTG